MSYCFKLVYKINDNNDGKNEFTRIFDEDFVKRNRNKSRIIYKYKEYSLKEFFEEIDKDCKPGQEIKFKFRFLHSILNLYRMFYCCNNLLSITDDTKVNQEQVVAKLKYGLSISKRKEKEYVKIIDIGCMFYGCKSLKSLPDLSKWNIKNVIFMESIFYECESLISLPDLAKWNTENITDMSEIFYRCVSLKSLPDLSKWNTENITDMSGIFFDVYH